MRISLQLLMLSILSVAVLGQVQAQEWELMKAANDAQKIDPAIGLEGFYIPKDTNEIHVKQDYDKSAFPFVTNKNWPRLKDFDFTFEFKFHVPEGAKCRETPMLKLMSHANDGDYRTFYRGYHYANFEEKVGRYKNSLMHSKIMATKADTWFAVRYACKGKVLKGKFWVVAEGEPDRWTIEAETYEEPRAGQIGFAYRAWKDQPGTEIIFKNFEVTEFKGDTFEYLDPKTRPERTTASVLGRELVGFPFEYYAAPDCKWPTRTQYVRTEDWAPLLSKIAVPEGWAQPVVENGNLVLQVPEMKTSDENKVAWFNQVFGIQVLEKFEIHCSEGLTPLLWYQNMNTKNGADPWDTPKGVFDPFAQDGLATVFSVKEQRISAYGTNHLFPGENKYKFVTRFRNGVAMWYGTPDEVCDILEPTLPSVPWNGKPRIGFSAKGKAGTITVTPISYSK